jgi:hypothetical protein
MLVTMMLSNGSDSCIMLDLVSHLLHILLCLLNH